MKIAEQVERLKDKISGMAEETLKSGHHGWIVITMKHSKVESIHQIKDRDVRKETI